MAALVAGALSVLLAAAAGAWPLGELNRTITETNFIVDDVCSGTLISVKLRLVLTNYHCIADKITVVEKEEPGADGTVKKVRRERRENVTLTQRAYKGFERVGAAEYVAAIVAHKRTRDLAVLQLKAEAIPHRVESKILPDGRQLVRGERVYMVGNPTMLDASVVDGIISNLNRTLETPWAESEKLPFIQTSAPGIGGNSGGALYTDDGYLIGVPARGIPGVMTLAIPVTLVKEVLREGCFASVFDPTADDAKCREMKKAKAEKQRAANGD